MEFVKYNNNARNSINVTKTLANKHQKNFATRLEYFIVIGSVLRIRITLMRIWLRLRIQPFTLCLSGSDLSL